MKTVCKITMLILLAALSAAVFPARGFADTTPQEMHISCKAPNPAHQTGLHRPKGDGNIWTFQLVLDGDAHFVKGPYWDYPGKGGSDPDWGVWTGGADGDSSLGWSSPGKTGTFQVRVSGQIGCGNGSGGHPIDFSAGWDGSVDFNADIKVKRSGSDDSFASSATVAAGGLGSSEHKADVQVTATDSDGNPMSGISVPAPTIQNGDGVNADASISPSSATSDYDGKADFTFTSSDIKQDVTLKEDGGESKASASITQAWTAYLDDGNWDYNAYFYDDTASPLSFKMALNADGSAPIRGHDIHFVTIKIIGDKWNPYGGYDGNGGYDPATLVGDEIAKEGFGGLVTYSNGDAATESPAGSGVYTGRLTVHSNDNFWVDTIYFNATDWKNYKP